MQLPDDIKPEWLSVIRRLQSVKNEGLAVIKISIMVDQENKPIVWAEPKITRIEPKSQILSLLTLLTDK